MTAARSRLPLLVVAAVALQAGAARAATFQVAPVRIELSAAKGSEIVTLRSQDEKPVRLQITAHAWTQSRQGQVVLDDTDDVVVFPSMLTLAPGETRRVRVGTTAKPGGSERSWRILVEELPPLSPEGRGLGVAVLTRMSIPVFLSPRSKAAAQPALGSVRADAGRLSFAVENEGTAHMMVRRVTATLVDAAGRPLAVRSVDGWYVLPGSGRDFAVDLGDGACAAAAVTFEVELDRGSLRRAVSAPPGLCPG